MRLSARARRAIGATLAVGLGIVVMSSVSGCASLFDGIANTLLANEVRQDDREAPHTARALLPGSEEMQLVGGKGEGLSCSLPPGAQALAFDRDPKKQAPIALQMRQACA